MQVQACSAVCNWPVSMVQLQQHGIFQGSWRSKAMCWMYFNVFNFVSMLSNEVQPTRKNPVQAEEAALKTPMTTTTYLPLLGLASRASLAIAWVPCSCFPVLRNVSIFTCILLSMAHGQEDICLIPSSAHGQVISLFMCQSVSHWPWVPTRYKVSSVSVLDIWLKAYVVSSRASSLMGKLLLCCTQLCQHVYSTVQNQRFC